MSNPAIVCTLSPEAVAARRAQLLPALSKRAEACEDTVGGLRLKFPATTEVLDLVSRTIDAERQCCRFLRFEVTVEPDGGPIWLSISGPPGAKEFLAALIDS
jgi:hypothetical protein